jgi:predicted P-loop ATPase
MEQAAIAKPTGVSGGMSVHIGAAYDFITEAWEGRWRYNTRSNLYEYKRHNHIDYWEPFGSKELGRTPVLLWEDCSHSCEAKLVKPIVEQLAHDNPYDPVLDYLQKIDADDSIQPDPIATQLLKHCFLLEDEMLNKLWMLFMVGAVKRVFEPGCDWKYMPILAGPQSIRKSGFLDVLFGEDYCSSITVASRINWNQLKVGCSLNWVTELSECDHFFKGNESKLKDFLSGRRETIEKKFKDNARFTRNWVTVGTTNREQFLGDATGAVRWWPIPLWHLKESQVCFTDKELATHRDGIWKAVLNLYNDKYKGDSNPILLDKETEEYLTASVKDAYTEDPIEDVLANYVIGKTFVGWEAICAALDMSMDKVTARNSQHKQPIIDALLKLGFKYGQRRHDLFSGKAKRGFWCDCHT